MPTMRVCHFATEIGVSLETVIDALEILQARNPKQKIGRHQNSNLTEEGQEAVREILAEGIVEARPDGKPELPADAPAVGAMRVVDFAEEVGQSVAVVCAELAALGEKSHHLSNIEPAAQDLLRCVFARDLTPGPAAADAAFDAAVDVPENEDFPEQESAPEPDTAETFYVDAAGDCETIEQTAEIEEIKAANATELLANVDAFLEIHETTTAEAFAADPEGAETMPQSDRFALVTPQGHPTGEYECLSPDHAAIVRERIGDRKLMGLTLNLDRKFLVFVTWPDGQKYEVPV